MEYILSNLLLPNLRTIKMLECNFLIALVVLIIFTMLVTKGVMPLVIGNTIGGDACSVSLLAYKNRKK